MSETALTFSFVGPAPSRPLWTDKNQENLRTYGLHADSTGQHCLITRPRHLIWDNFVAECEQQPRYFKRNANASVKFTSMVPVRVTGPWSVDHICSQGHNLHAASLLQPIVRCQECFGESWERPCTLFWAPFKDSLVFCKQERMYNS